MPSFLTKRLAASVLAFALSLSAHASLLHLIPEQSDIVISIDDLSTFKERSQNNPFVAAWSHPAIVEWTAPMREQMDWIKANESLKKESGKTFEELEAMIEGGLLLSVSGLSEGNLEDWAKHPDVILLADVGTNTAEFHAFLEETLKNDNDDEGEPRKVNRETYGDAEVVEVVNRAKDEKGDLKPSVFWAIHEGLFVLSARRESVLSILDAQRHGSAQAPFDQGRHYAQIEQRAGQHDLVAYLNGQSIYRAIANEVEKKAADQPPNPMGFSPVTILPALGFDRFEMLYLTAHLEADQTINRYGVTHNGSPNGLWNMMPADAGRFPEPTWMPETWTTASTARFDVANVFNELEKIAAQISPMVMGMWQGIQMQVQQNMGIDLKNGLFNTFGDEVVGAQFFEGEPGIDFTTVPLGQQPQLLAIKLRDAETFRKTFNTALQTALQGLRQFMEVRDYLGQELMVFKTPNPAIPGASQTIGLAITDDTLFVSLFTTVPLEQVLQSMANPGTGSFWDRDDVQDSMVWVAGDASTYQRQDAAALMAQVVKTITNLAAMQEQMAAAAAEAVDEEGNPLDEPELPDNPFIKGFDHAAAPDIAILRELFGPIISYGVSDGDGIHLEARIQHVIR